MGRAQTVSVRESSPRGPVSTSLVSTEIKSPGQNTSTGEFGIRELANQFLPVALTIDLFLG